MTGGILETMVIGAAVGAGTAAATGGDPKKGAIFGAAGGGVGAAVAPAAAGVPTGFSAGGVTTAGAAAGGAAGGVAAGKKKILKSPQPSILTPDPSPEPLMTEEVRAAKARVRGKKKGRRATILAGRMMAGRRDILNTGLNTKLGE